ncbi:MAG TPA: DUF1207 domain-containing protein [Bacteroidota bacterium]|nr:DUF1207 domain-containing protein [Bacteroidota bacterium]
MIRTTLLAAVLVMAFAQISFPQVSTTTQDDRWQFLPGGTMFKPLVANPQEPRVGVRKEIGSSRLKLDIGSMVDFVQFAANDSGTLRLRMGADFFTYALTTSAQGLRLQVDAVDGFFGGHIVMRCDDGPRSFTLRLRLLHLSAHLIDGHFDNATGQWKNGQLPIPFTKDFGELTAAYEFPLAWSRCLVYSGFNYATLVRPTDIKRIMTLHGIELRTRDNFATVLGKPFALYTAYNITLTGVPSYIGTNVVEAGVKFGRWDDIGLKFYVNYVSGLEFFSQYYNVRRNMGGLGFAVDFY